MKHQKVGVKRLGAAPEFFALGCEQGTGKTWMLLADAERQFKAGEIDALFVIAPKGVHVNWALREIPAHLEIPHKVEYWLSGAGIKHQRKLDRLLTHNREDGLVIVTMNVDAVNTKTGFNYAKKFLKVHRSMIVVDESQRIKNPAAKRTQRILELRDLSKSRRISSGTLVADSPIDLFAQYEFLSDGLLGTTSYRAFIAEFSELLPAGHPLVEEIRTRNHLRGVPQVVKKDEMGRPVYRNLEKLSKLMSPHTYRVLKKDCLDLPDKIYQSQYFELEPVQRKIYDQVKSEMRWEREDGDIDTFTALTMINKLQQLTSGFILVDGQSTELANATPRLAALKEVIEDTAGQIIIWARFRAEIERIVKELRSKYNVVQYHGGTPQSERDAAVDAFQLGEARIFIANPAAGGTGLTLTAASTVIYYSCSFSLEERVQSEDRAHRIGTHHPVIYVDLIARDTIDERIAAALQAKAGVATEIMDAL